MNSRVTALSRRPASISSEIIAARIDADREQLLAGAHRFANDSAPAPVENRKPYGRRHHMSVPFDVRYQIRGGRISTSCCIETSSDTRTLPQPAVAGGQPRDDRGVRRVVLDAGPRVSVRAMIAWPDRSSPARRVRPRLAGRPDDEQQDRRRRRARHRRRWSRADILEREPVANTAQVKHILIAGRISPRCSRAGRHDPRAAKRRKRRRDAVRALVEQLKAAATSTRS